MYTDGTAPDGSRTSPAPRPPGPAAQVASVGGSRPPPGRGRSGPGSTDDSGLGGSISGRPSKKSQTMTTADIKNWQKAVAPIPLGGAGIPPPISNKARRPLPPKGGNAHPHTSKPAIAFNPNAVPLGSSPVVPPGLGDLLAKGVSPLSTISSNSSTTSTTSSGAYGSPTSSASPSPAGGSRKIPTGAVAVPALAGGTGPRPPLPVAKAPVMSPARAGSIGTRPPPLPNGGTGGPHPPRPMSANARPGHSSGSIGPPPRPPGSAGPGGGGGGGGAAAPPKAEPKLTKEEKKRRTRDRVANEIVTTEKSYVDSLDTLCELYIRPLTIFAKDDERCILTDKEIAILFSNLQLITSLNQKFLLDLEKRLQKWDDKACMGDLFLEFSPYFKMYTGYVSNHDNATQFLKKSEKANAKFAEFLVKGVAEPRANGTNLASYLIMPIQRIPRYKLLLQELVKNTEDSHPDFTNLSKALDSVSVVATGINEAVKQQENRNTILAIQDKFSGNPDLISPSRRFIRQGPLTKQCRSSDKTYEFFLFNDLLVYAEKNTVTRKYKLHRRMDINSSFFVQDLADKEDEKEKNRFQIVSSQKSFIVYSTDAATKTDWLKDLYTCIGSRRQAIGVQEVGDVVAPVWQSDSSSRLCYVCEKSFSLFNRRHHCRYCGNLVCQACSTKRMIITGHAKGGSQTQTLKGEPQRVCDKCVAQLQNTGTAPKKPDDAVEKPDKKEKPEKADGEESDSDDDTDLQQGATDIMSMKTQFEKKAKKEEKQEHQYKAVYPYVAVEPEDLTFSEGDLIVVVSKDNSGWWRGYIEGTNIEGNFPSNYVVEIGDDYLTEIEIRVVATQDYVKRNDVELSLKTGDLIHVTSRDNSGWYYGTNAEDGKAGWFQSIHVEEMAEEENGMHEDTTSEYSADMSISRSTASSGLNGSGDEAHSRIEHDFPMDAGGGSNVGLPPPSSMNGALHLHTDDSHNSGGGPPSPPSEPNNAKDTASVASAPPFSSSSAHHSAPSSPSHAAAHSSSALSSHRPVSSPQHQRPGTGGAFSSSQASSHHAHAASHDSNIHPPPSHHPTTTTNASSTSTLHTTQSADSVGLSSGAHPPPKPKAVPPPPATVGGVPTTNSSSSSSSSPPPSTVSSPTTSSGKQPPPKPNFSRTNTQHSLASTSPSSSPENNLSALTIQPPSSSSSALNSPSGASSPAGHPPKPQKPRPPGHFANKPSKVSNFKALTPRGASPADSSEAESEASGAGGACSDCDQNCQEFQKNMFKLHECKTCRHPQSQHA